MKTFAPSIVIFVLMAGIIGCAILRPKTPEQNYDLAKHYQAEGDYVQADRFLTKAIEKKPDYMEAYLFRAQISVQRDSLVRAIADYTTILDKFPLATEKRGQMLTLRGNTYRANLQDSLACQDWDVACEKFGTPSACTSKRKYCKK